jgi:hypothetical protein
MGLPYDCFNIVHTQYSEMLLGGFTTERTDGHRNYHPAIKAIILMNEPELAMRYNDSHGQPLCDEELRGKGYYTKALLSAFDAALDAENSMKIVPDKDGRLPPFTVTYSYDICQHSKPNGICISAAAGNMAGTLNVGRVNALPFMYDFVLGAMSPSLFGYEAKGRVSLRYGVQNRFVLSYNTQFTAEDSCETLFKAIGATPLRNMPLFVGEFHNPDWSVAEFKAGLNTMRSYINNIQKCGNLENPIRGMTMMEFQKAYFKGSNDKQDLYMAFSSLEIASWERR